MKKLILAAAVVAMAASCANGNKNAVTTTKSGLDPQNFIAEYNGQPTALYTLTNDNGMEVCITNFGGRIVSIMVPSKDGSFKDVVLGFDKVTDYFPENNSSDFGAAIGRYANRIAGASFELDGVEYQLPANDSEHCLHGGPTGWQYQVYEVVEADETHIKILRDSPAGDNNFPGNVKAYVTYTLTENNAIDIKYEATTDAPTVINMTNHSYFNLGGDPSKDVLDNIMTINASQTTPVVAGLIPTGEIVSLLGTALDFTQPKVIGQDINSDFEQVVLGNGFDHNWVLDTAGDDTKVAATVVSPESGIQLDVYTNEPGIQVYSGNFLDGTITGKNGIVYNQRAGICLESQHYPDTPHKADWPSVVLRPGEKYYSHCIFAFSVVE
ncbi:MAG: aldose epimerase family protein [Bacteroidia bacterium]|nr:aldose epimerase family protein [Bacteroidia bacterium]